MLYVLFNQPIRNIGEFGAVDVVSGTYTGRGARTVVNSATKARPKLGQQGQCQFYNNLSVTRSKCHKYQVMI